MKTIAILALTAAALVSCQQQQQQQAAPAPAPAPAPVVAPSTYGVRGARKSLSENTILARPAYAGRAFVLPANEKKQNTGVTRKKAAGESSRQGRRIRNMTKGQ